MCTTSGRLTHILGSSQPQGSQYDTSPSQAPFHEIHHSLTSCFKQAQYVLDSSYTVAIELDSSYTVAIELDSSYTAVIELDSSDTVVIELDSSYTVVTELGTMNSPPTAGPKRDDVRLEVSDKPLPETRDVENQNGDDESEPLLLRGPESEETLAEMEINSLRWIKQPGNEALKEALETWQAKDELFAKRVDKKRLQSSSLRNEIYQLIGFYSVFQGVLLTAVAQSNLLYCHNWWTAFFLSLLASLVTIAGVIQKFRSVLALEWTISNEETSRKDCIKLGQKLIRKRETFSLREDTQDSTRPVPKQTQLKVSVVLVVLVLLLFSALFLASILQILCDSGAPGPAPSP